MTQIFMIGTSLGANITANLVGEQGTDCKLAASVSLQPPMWMQISSEYIRNSLGGLYSKKFAEDFKERLPKYLDTLQEPWLENHGVDVTKVINEMQFLHDLDANATAIVNGFGTLENYYDKASCGHRIPSISIPTFFMLALDDPIIGGRTVDYDLCKKNPNVLLGVTRKGGHVGYHENLFGGKQWFLGPCFAFLDAYRTDITN